jgi:hypothetical protein
MRIQVFIFNYALFKAAHDLYENFTNVGLDTFLLNCRHNNDPEFEATDRIKKYDNIFYSGLWNKALELTDADAIFLVNSDVTVFDYTRLMRRLTGFYEKYGDKAGIYAPNFHWTPWTYNPNMLEDLGDGLKCVPSTDSTIWCLPTSIAHKIGQMDLGINLFGWGIEVIAAYYCSLENKIVARDYGVRCAHPRATAYNRTAADRQWRSMVGKMNLGQGFWDYYNSRDKYGFGWQGNDDPEKFRVPTKLKHI